MDADQRTRAAKSIVANPLWREALQEMRTTATRAWEASRDPAAQADQWHLMRAIAKIETYIEALARGGKHE